MTGNLFLYNILGKFPIVAAAVLCCLPMKNQMKRARSEVIIDTLIYLMILISVVSYLLISL